MSIQDYRDTTIGSDYLDSKKTYDTDILLDYLAGLLKCRNDQPENKIWVFKYDREIEATKEILKLQTEN